MKCLFCEVSCGAFGALLPPFGTPESLIKTYSESRIFKAVACPPPRRSCVPMDPAKWLYPTNFTFRPYQHAISRSAIRKNTLVCIPTGMGKTLIAAVVMKNFAAYFPHKKVVFLAPTKPLVHQQMEAIRNAVDLPRNICVELTGSISAKKRKEAWRLNTFAFLTPQTFSNDLNNGICPAVEIVCVIVDEAHKATGNHSYVTAVQKLSNIGSAFRVVALSATPGGNASWMQQVVSNLFIETVEWRDESSVDVIGTLKERTIDKIVVPQTKLFTAARAAVLDAYRGVLDRLGRIGIQIGNDPVRVKRYQLLLIMQSLDASSCMPEHKRTQAAWLNVAMMMAYGVELISSHGCGSALEYFSRELNMVQSARQAEGGRRKLSTTLREEVFRSNSFAKLLGTLQNATKVVYGSVNVDSHPKLNITRDLIQQHILKHGSEARVMVFSSIRDSVEELTTVLEGVEGVLPFRFVGQATSNNGGHSRRGLTQKRQREVIRQFRDGVYNVLVCTCIGEEGLDIGEVDLIVCYDISPSAIRQTQRAGRTGRRSSVRVVVLVTEGVEEDTYERSLKNGKAMKRAIRRSNQITFGQPLPSPLPLHAASECEMIKFSPSLEEPSPPSVAPAPRRRHSDIAGHSSALAVQDEEEQTSVNFADNKTYAQSSGIVVLHDNDTTHIGTNKAMQSYPQEQLVCNHESVGVVGNISNPTPANYLRDGDVQNFEENTLFTPANIEFAPQSPDEVNLYPTRQNLGDFMQPLEFNTQEQKMSHRALNVEIFLASATRKRKLRLAGKPPPMPKLFSFRVAEGSSNTNSSAQPLKKVITSLSPKPTLSQSPIPTPSQSPIPTPSPSPISTTSRPPIPTTSKSRIPLRTPSYLSSPLLHANVAGHSTNRGAISPTDTSTALRIRIPLPHRPDEFGSQDISVQSKRLLANKERQRFIQEEASASGDEEQDSEAEEIIMLERSEVEVDDKFIDDATPNSGCEEWTPNSQVSNRRIESSSDDELQVLARHHQLIRRKRERSTSGHDVISQCGPGNVDDDIAVSPSLSGSFIVSDSAEPSLHCTNSLVSPSSSCVDIQVDAGMSGGPLRRLVRAAEASYDQVRSPLRDTTNRFERV